MHVMLLAISDSKCINTTVTNKHNRITSSAQLRLSQRSSGFIQYLVCLRLAQRCSAFTKYLVCLRLAQRSSALINYLVCLILAQRLSAFNKNLICLRLAQRNSVFIRYLACIRLEFLVLCLEFEGTKNTHVVIWSFGGCWRFQTGVWNLDLYSYMVTGL